MSWMVYEFQWSQINRNAVYHFCQRNSQCLVGWLAASCREPSHIVFFFKFCFFLWFFVSDRNDCFPARGRLVDYSWSLSCTWLHAHRSWITVSKFCCRPKALAGHWRSIHKMQYMEGTFNGSIDRSNHLLLLVNRFVFKWCFSLDSVSSFYL